MPLPVAAQGDVVPGFLSISGALRPALLCLPSPGSGWWAGRGAPRRAGRKLWPAAGLTAQKGGRSAQRKHWAPAGDEAPGSLPQTENC